jgi:uncharacterized protein (DUF1330 family)
MSYPVEPERLNQEGFMAYAARATDGSPVVMLNLLRFNPDGGRERYEEYGAAVAPLLEKVGGEVRFLGRAGLPLLSGGPWDLVLLVEYPSRQAFLDMVGSEEYGAIARLRTEALAEGELHPLEPGDLSAT